MKKENLFVIFVLLISITIFVQNNLSAVAYLSTIPNSTNQTTATPIPNQPYTTCPPNYTPANFPCTITIDNYTKVIGAPQGIANNSTATTSVVPEFGSFASMIIALSIIGVIIISKKPSFHISQNNSVK